MLELTTNEGLTLSGVVVAVIGVVVAVLVHLHNRSFRGTSKGRSLTASTCPHVYLNFRDDTGAIEIVPTFLKPVGRFDFTCQRCGLNGIYDERLVQTLTYSPVGSTLNPLATSGLRKLGIASTSYKLRRIAHAC